MWAIGKRGRRMALGLASGGLVLATVASVQAQDGGGSFFERLFGGVPQQQSPVAQPRYERQWPFDQGYRARAERRHGRVARTQQPRARYVALPKADPDTISGKQPVDQKAIQDNPTKAILNDKTLRAGDIVMLPNGPRVFVGGPDKRHQIGEFQDVKSSQMVDRKTRQQLLAMMVPVGAMPADQARKVMAQTRAMKKKLAHPDEIAAVEASNREADEPTPLRIIVPWQEGR